MKKKTKIEKIVQGEVEDFNNKWYKIAKKKKEIKDKIKKSKHK